MLCGLHQVSDDRFLAERLAGFQPMQALDQDEAIAVTTHQDRRLLPDLEHALRKLLHGRGLERRAALHRHIDVRDWEFLALHHGWAHSAATAGGEAGNPTV